MQAEYVDVIEIRELGILKNSQTIWSVKNAANLVNVMCFVEGKFKILFDEWFLDVKLGFDNKEAYIIVKRLNRLFNYAWINPEKENNIVLGEKDYLHAGIFIYGFACVQNIESKWNFISSDGRIISPIWYKSVTNFGKGVLMVQLEDSTFNFIDNKGMRIFSDQNFTDVSYVSEGFLKVKFSDFYYLLDLSNYHISKEYFSYINNAIKGKINGCSGIIAKVRMKNGRTALAEFMQIGENKIISDERYQDYHFTKNSNFVLAEGNCGHYNVIDLNNRETLLKKCYPYIKIFSDNECLDGIIGIVKDYFGKKYHIKQDGTILPYCS